MNGLLTALFLLTAVSGCQKDDISTASKPLSFASFRDIPEITADEIHAIEKLQTEYDSFVYGMNLTIEAFEDCLSDGEIRGFSALFCEWLTGLFGIPFEVKLYNWGNLIAGLESGEVDFSGDLMATPERKANYFMTDSIVERSLRTFRIEGGLPLSVIARSRPPRFAFLENSAVFAPVAETAEYPFESVFVNNFAEAYNVLKNGEADAFLVMGISEAAFDAYGDIASEVFLPLVFNSASLATRNPRLAPVIGVVQKALQYDAVRHHLADLYKTGYNEYRRHSLFMQLTEDELAYILNNPVVKFAAEIDNYPVSFYNNHENSWQGIALEVLEELENITGLKFEIANDTNVNWSILLNMLERGDVAMITELVRTTERTGRFLWPSTAIMEDRAILLSRIEYPDIDISEIQNIRIGVNRGTVYAELFKRWFPNHPGLVEYNNLNDAMNALERGEVDLMMGRTNQFLNIINYQEMFGYKVNVIFNNYFQTILGFNKNEKLLCSIVDKALLLIDTESISMNWSHKAYDYRYKLIETQRPWLLGAIGLSLCVVALILVLLQRNRQYGKNLEDQVRNRTAELEEMVTEMVTLQKDLETAVNDAQNANIAKSRFIATMSHEMRTPMNAVVGLTDLMLEEDIPSVVKENLKKISIAGKTLTGIINDILDISKIETSKLELLPKRYDMASLLNDIIVLNITRIGEKPISLNLDIDKNLPCVISGDELRVKQIINNLLSNAFKYTQQGTVTLGVRCERAGDMDVWLSIYVSDTGIGISPENIEKLFSNYNQVDTEANRKVDGTGLGLSITKRLVERMEGEISVASEFGKGSTFRVRIRQGFVIDIPLSPITLKNLAGFKYMEKQKLRNEKLIRPDLSHARVLVVDDMQTNLDVVASMLRKYKISVDCVTSGQDAINHINAGEPVYHIIFMDHMMPEMDGIETAERIRLIGTEYAQQIPIIALTANAAVGNEKMFLENGFQAFLPKPVNIMELDSVVRKWRAK
jgi:signal transduction histidine kinase/ABC-type amino acid transport substrate-binding protein/ActR/RegA family two-component response regulator